MQLQKANRNGKWKRERKTKTIKTEEGIVLNNSSNKTNNDDNNYIEWLFV